MTEDDALVVLAHIVEPAEPQIADLVARLGPSAVVDGLGAGSIPLRNGAALQERARRVDLGHARAAAERIGARIITRQSSQWPQQLDDLGATRPYALWVLGAADLRMTLVRSLSVVGTRASTAYGEHVARDWCSAFTEHHLTVVSGGAFGIDAAAHRAVLAAGGMTICVLASGVDVPYPRAHDALIHRIADDGLVLSESPLGEPARRQRFLTRNRVIAALTPVTMVVESALRSGSLSTANAAARLNRVVLAVPGPVTSPESAGCHALIARGAAQIADSASVAIEMVAGFGAAQPPGPVRGPLDDLPNTALAVLDALPARGDVDAGALAVQAALAIPDVLTALGLLEGHGLVRATESGWALARA